MRQFLNAQASSFYEMRQGARDNDSYKMRFRNEQMPYGSVPFTASVVFEFHTDDAVSLVVDKGVRCQGVDASVQNWLAQGEFFFKSIEELVAWLHGPLKKAFDVQSMDEDEQPPLSIESMVENLNNCVLGQGAAIRSLCSHLFTHIARTSYERPSVICFVGPSGVGKTESAKAAAGLLSGGGQGKKYGFLHLDMNEYKSDGQSQSQLIGSPRGYRDSGRSSPLLNAVASNPRMIVLFDEIEKAHSTTFEILMNAMDDGRLTGARDTAVDFTKCIFIFTSNLRSEEILSDLNRRDGFGNREIESDICCSNFREAGILSEVIGRIQKFIVFRPLGPDTKFRLVQKMIVELARGYSIEITGLDRQVLIRIVKKAQTHNIGARGLRNTVESELAEMFAREALQGIKEISLTGSRIEHYLVRSGSG